MLYTVTCDYGIFDNYCPDIKVLATWLVPDYHFLKNNKMTMLIEGTVESIWKWPKPYIIHSAQDGFYYDEFDYKTIRVYGNGKLWEKLPDENYISDDDKYFDMLDAYEAALDNYDSYIDDYYDLDE